MIKWDILKIKWITGRKKPLQNDDDSDDEDEAETRREALEETYSKICRMTGTRPCPRFRRQITSETMDISNCRLTLKDIKSVSVAVMSNVYIKHLDLSHNDLSGKGIEYLCEGLRENTSVDRLSIANCNIGLDELKHITSCLLTSKPIRTLDMSQNNFNKHHATILAEVIKTNTKIEELSLSGNKFDDPGGVVLGQALVKNTGIRRLDLSWNHLRLNGAIAVCAALKVNDTIEELDLSWNGLAEEGCKALGLALPHNHTLIELNISCNRINMFSLEEFLKGIAKNDTLNVLKIDQNPLTTDGAIALLKTLETSDVSEVSEIHIADIPINGDFMEALEDLQEVKLVQVYHRDPNRKKITQIARERTLADFDPALILFEYMKQENLRLIDLFRTFDTDSSMTLSKDEIKEGLMMVNLPLSDDAVDTIVDKFDINDNKEVEYDECKIGYRKAMQKMRSYANSDNKGEVESMHRLTHLVKKAQLERMASKAALRKPYERRQRQSSMVAVLNTEDGEKFLKKLQEKHRQSLDRIQTKKNSKRKFVM